MDFERAKIFIDYTASSEVDEAVSPYERFMALWERVQNHRGMLTGYDESGTYKLTVWCDTVWGTGGRLRELGAEWFFEGESYLSEKLAMSEPNQYDEYSQPTDPEISILAQLEDSVATAEQWDTDFQARMA